MLPSNYSSYHPNHQQENDGDFPQPYYQSRPHMQMHNYAQPHIEQQQFEQNQKHVQMHQSQISSSSPAQNYYLNNPPHSQAPLRTRSDNGSSTPQYSSSIQKKSVLGQRPFASNSPSAEMSFQTSSGQLEGRGSGSHTGHGDSAQVLIRPTDAPRRGRPPKNASGTPAPKTQKPSIPKRRGRPPKDYTALAKNADLELLMAKDQKTTHAKKSNSQSDDNQPKRRGRPPKQPSPEVEIQAPNPMYLIYKCEWNNCPAQLHNLATLRFHLFKNHGKKENAMYSCLWKGCNTPKTTEGRDELVPESGRVTQYEFKDEDEWKSHVEKRHLTPYAWHMGDGPQNSLGMIYVFHIKLMTYARGRLNVKVAINILNSIRRTQKIRPLYSSGISFRQEWCSSDTVGRKPATRGWRPSREQCPEIQETSQRA